MKNLLSIILSISFTLTALTINAQNTTVETSFKVEGVCKMCKKRIETAAYIKGVKFAEWNKDTKMLKVTYKSSKVTAEEIHKAVAAVGHSTEKIKATDEALNNLPDCCRYDKGIETH